MGERTFNSVRQVSDTRILHLINSCLDFDLYFLFKEKHNISETRSVTVLRWNVGEELLNVSERKGFSKKLNLKEIALSLRPK